MCPHGHLKQAYALAIKYDAFVVTDEVYEHIVYAPSKIAFVHTLCTAREEKSTYIRLYKMFCQPNSLLGPQVWHPSRRFSGWSDLGRNMVGGQVSYRPLRCNSHGVQMYHIPIYEKIRCTVKAQLSLEKNGSCVFVFVHTTFQKRRMSILCATLSKQCMNMAA